MSQIHEKIKPYLYRNPSVILCLLVVVSFRFNRNDFFIKVPPSDSFEYEQLVRYFRGSLHDYVIGYPFCERIFTSFLASFLPFEPLTAINVVNVALLLLGIWLLKKVARLHDLSEDNVWLSCYLFIFSFPTFYYASIGNVDPGVLAMILLGWYAFLKEKWLLWGLAIFIGTLTKEGIVLIIPIAFLWFWKNGQIRKSIFVSFLSFWGYILLWSVIKSYAPTAVSPAPSLYWLPNVDRAISNMSRLNFWLSSFFSLGIPFVLVVRNWRQFQKNRADSKNLLLCSGICSGILLWGYTIFSAYADGRFIWLTYGFWILLALKLEQERESLKNHRE